MDPITRANVMGAAGAGVSTGPTETLDSTTIGDSANGGYFAGYISHTANSTPTHGLIIAPKATGAGGGYHTAGSNLVLSNNTSTTYGGTSWFDGAYNSALISPSDSPIISFINNLSIGGYTDWYLPAAYELEIAFYNLKPTTANNITGNSFYGTNAYAVPARSGAYLAQTPSQTSVTAFQWNNSESFYGGSVSFPDYFKAFYWSSTERFAHQNWYFDVARQPGRIDSQDKNITYRKLSFVAFRKVAL